MKATKNRTGAYVHIIHAVYHQKKEFEMLFDKHVEDMLFPIFELLWDEWNSVHGLETSRIKEVQDYLYQVVKLSKNGPAVEGQMNQWLGTNEKKNELGLVPVLEGKEKVKQILSFIRDFSRYVPIIEYKLKAAYVKGILSPLFRIVYEEYQIDRGRQVLIEGMRVSTDGPSFEEVRRSVLNRINQMARGALTEEECFRAIEFLTAHKIGYVYHLTLLEKKAAAKIVEIEENANLHLIVSIEGKKTHIPIEASFFMEMPKELIGFHEVRKGEKLMCRTWIEQQGFWTKQYHDLFYKNADQSGNIDEHKEMSSVDRRSRISSVPEKEVSMQTTLVIKDDRERKEINDEELFARTYHHLREEGRLIDFASLQAKWNEKEMLLHFEEHKNENGELNLAWDEEDVAILSEIPKSSQEKWSTGLRNIVREFISEKELEEEEVECLVSFVSSRIEGEAEVSVMCFKDMERNLVLLLRDEETTLMVSMIHQSSEMAAI